MRLVLACLLIVLPLVAQAAHPREFVVSNSNEAIGWAYYSFCDPVPPETQLSLEVKRLNKLAYAQCASGKAALKGISFFQYQCSSPEERRPKYTSDISAVYVCQLN